jgi:hypothetical protein
MKKLDVITAATVRKLVEEANKKEISKDQIVSVFNDNGQFIMLYEGKNN